MGEAVSDKYSSDTFVRGLAKFLTGKTEIANTILGVCHCYREGSDNQTIDLIPFFTFKGVKILKQTFLARFISAAICFDLIFWISFQHLLKKKKTLRPSHFLLCRE